MYQFYVSMVCFYWNNSTCVENSKVEANMQPVGLHWLNSEADDLAEDDNVVYGSQDPMIIPDSSQDDVVEGFGQNFVMTFTKY